VKRWRRYARAAKARRSGETYGSEVAAARR
jgi:hypothetical protein